MYCMYVYMYLLVVFVAETAISSMETLFVESIRVAKLIIAALQVRTIDAVVLSFSPLSVE